MPETDPDALLSTAKVARILGVAPKTVTELVKPVVVKPSGRRFYTLRSVRSQLDGEAA